MVTKGQYYGMVVAWDCGYDVSYYYDYNGGTTLDAGFGDTQVAGHQDFSIGDYDSGSSATFSSSTLRYFMNIDVTEL